MKYILLAIISVATAGCLHFNPQLHYPTYEETAADYRKSMDGHIKACYDNYVVAHPDENEETLKLLRKRTLFMGMTQEQAIAAFGHPYKVNTSVGSWGIHKQVIYEGYPFYSPLSHRRRRAYLYFEDGKLTSWQTKN